MIKKAVLVVSFGTSYADTRKRTIGAIERRMEERFPDREICRAWTSGFIIKKVARDEGLTVDTPAEALQRLAASGITDLIVQPTHLSDGYENRRMLEIVKEYSGRFEKVTVGRPLLFTEEDRKYVAELMPKLCLGKANEMCSSQARFDGADGVCSEKRCAGDEDRKDTDDARDNTALLLMGHGSDKHPVPVYEQLQQVFFDEGADNVFVATVEGTPTFEDAEKRLRESGCRKVVLAPLMIVAGDHAVNDMAGDSPDSWRSRLQAVGYETQVILKGLGEYAEIQERFVEHALEAGCV